MIRAFPFTQKYLREEAENQGEVDSIEKFRELVMRYGQNFLHDQGAGSAGDIFVFAWKEESGEWYPVLAL